MRTEIVLSISGVVQSILQYINTEQTYFTSILLSSVVRVLYLNTLVELNKWSLIGRINRGRTTEKSALTFSVGLERRRLRG